jgi:hypothetical protein
MTDLAAPVSAPAAQEAAPGSFVRRAADTFLAPIALFQRFGARPPWVDVTVLSVVLMLGAMLMVPQSVFVQTMKDALIQRGQPVPAGAEGMAGVQRIATLVATVVMPWIGLVVTGGILTLLFSVLMGGKATFRQYVSVAAHAGLIGAVGMWAKLPIILHKQDLKAGITLAALLPSPDPAGFTYRFLNAWDAFAVWQFVVLALGVAALNRRIGSATTLAVILGLYAAIMAAVAALT